MTEEQKITAIGKESTDIQNAFSIIQTATSNLSGHNFGTMSETNLGYIINGALLDQIFYCCFAPNKPNCDAFNSMVKAIGIGWGACIVAADFSPVAIIACSVAALSALDANDKAYPDCANGGNQDGLNTHPWLISGDPCSN